jgi:hypothetical protein
MVFRNTVATTESIVCSVSLLDTIVPFDSKKLARSLCDRGVGDTIGVSKTQRSRNVVSRYGLVGCHRRRCVAGGRSLGRDHETCMSLRKGWTDERETEIVGVFPVSCFLCRQGKMARWHERGGECRSASVERKCHFERLARCSKTKNEGAVSTESGSSSESCSAS